MIPLVSIIVPVYKVEKYIEKCINSIRSQSLKDIEIILVDDGSTDNCPSICDKYAQSDPRIKVIHKKNEGLGYARNSGLEIATGEYVGFVDSDDYVSDIMYEQLYTKAKSGDYDCVYSGEIDYYSENRLKEIKRVSHDSIFEGDSLNDFILDMISCDFDEVKEVKYGASVWCAIYRRSLIEFYNIKFLSEREYVSEDILFQIDFLEHAQRILYVSGCYYFYRQNNSSSLTKSFLVEKFDRFKKLRSRLLKKNNGDIFEERVDRLFFSFVKIHILFLHNSNVKKKYLIISNIVNDNVWDKKLNNNLKKIKKPSWQRYMALMLVHRCNFLLYIYTYLLSKIKNIVIKRRISVTD